MPVLVLSELGKTLKKGAMEQRQDSQNNTESPLNNKGIGNVTPEASIAPATPAHEPDKHTAPSPDAQPPQKTWGEKVFDHSVYGVAGYGINLGLSAVVSYGILENKHGTGFATFLRENVYKQTLGIKNKGLVETLTKAFTLLMGGHIVALTMIKPAEDHKSAIVRWLDKRHYGENAALDPAITQAHERIDQEAKPTYLGIMAARMSSWGMVQIAAALAGNEVNAVNKLGHKHNIEPLKKFKGIELHSKEAGTFIADNFTPKPISKGFNALYRPLVNPEPAVEHGLTSTGKSPLKAERQKTVYKEVLEYTFMDVFYTAITAITIKPINKFLMKHVPAFRHTPNTGDKPAALKTAYFLDRPQTETTVNEPSKEDTQTHVVSAVTHDGLLAQQQLQKA